MKVSRAASTMKAGEREVGTVAQAHDDVGALIIDLE
jgi:hypothetical protein